MFGSYSGKFGIFCRLLITEIDMFRAGLYIKKAAQRFTARTFHFLLITYLSNRIRSFLSFAL